MLTLKICKSHVSLSLFAFNYCKKTYFYFFFAFGLTSTNKWNSVENILFFHDKVHYYIRVLQAPLYFQGVVKYSKVDSYIINR